MKFIKVLILILTCLLLVSCRADECYNTLPYAYQTMEENKTDSSSSAADSVSFIGRVQCALPQAGEEIDLSSFGIEKVKVTKKIQPSLPEENISIYSVGSFRYQEPQCHDLFLILEQGNERLLFGLKTPQFDFFWNACDLDGDGYDELILHRTVGASGGAGQYVSQILKIADGQFVEIFNSNKNGFDSEMPFNTGFKSEYLAEKKVKVWNSFTDYEVIVDISEKYGEDFFDENGKGRHGELLCDSFFEFFPKDIDQDGVYEIETWQYASLIGHSDFFGYAKCILKYDAQTKSFSVIQSEITQDTLSKRFASFSL